MVYIDLLGRVSYGAGSYSMPAGVCTCTRVRAGQLHVRIGSDSNIQSLKKHAAMYNENERLYMVCQEDTTKHA